MSKFNELSGKLKAKKGDLNGINTKTTTSSKPEHNADNLPEKFCIAQTLKEVLNDSMSLSYYINFLESIGCLNLLKFWLHVDGFKMSCNETNSEYIKLDAENIFNTYLKSNAQLSICISERLRNIISVRLFCVNSKFVNSECFDEAQNFVWDLMVNRHFKKFLHSYFYVKYQLELLQSRKLLLYDILRSHQFLCSFIEYLEQIHQRKLLEFIIAADAFVAEFSNNINSFKLQEVAMIIYDRYFSMQATDSLGYSDEIRIEVEGSICTDNGIPNQNAFDKPKQLALISLQNNLIPAFMESHFFAKIIEMLKSNIENNIDVISPARLNCDNRLFNVSLKSSSSNSANNEFSETENKFENQLSLCENQDDEDDLVINNNKLNVHGSKRWRKQKNRCSPLAKIDQFGRYTPLFDNTIISCEEGNVLSARSRFKNTLDKYLNQTAAKESLVADEMAELIIGDIQKMVIMKDGVKH